MIGDLEARLQRQEDLEQIRRLKVAYFEACDGGFGEARSHVPEEIASTFTEDGVWDGGPYGLVRGRTALAAFYRNVPQMLAFTILSEPTIDIEGDKATGRWNVLVYSSSEAEGPSLVGGVHHDHYVRTEDGWKIARTRFVRAIACRSTIPWNAAG
jgi:hypothetical protein